LPRSPLLRGHILTGNSNAKIPNWGTPITPTAIGSTTIDQEKDKVEEHADDDTIVVEVEEIEGDTIIVAPA
jgi:hypothetical protein